MFKTIIYLSIGAAIGILLFEKHHQPNLMIMKAGENLLIIKDQTTGNTLKYNIQTGELV